MSEPKDIYIQNRKARHEYEIIEDFEVGLVLKGTEVKSLRNGKASLIGAFCRVFQDEMYVYGMHIDEYTQGNIFNHEPTRTRKLLMHKREIKRMIGLIERKGLTVVPLSCYFKRGYAKLKIALVRGKKLHDKRQDIKKRSTDRDIERAMKR